ncbi:DUF4352 domain-containing protein (plasmid) [Rhodococcus pyridinivorans]|uniref:DUF4352 domain-containing protein n=1 Tax=Rhodococcus pyridinivorans TaxID=103816 RepID=UPI001C301DF2|nr:DUF4352 domain-containing protein [Rhodococcus pyridinivorans]QXF84304.1 DUF4352 domain-containing protein [Rhodococcus pyridinivorans]
MRRRILAAAAVLTVSLVACGSNEADTSESPQPDSWVEGQIDQTPTASPEIPEVAMGETVTVTQEQYGATQGVTGTGTVTVSDYGPITPAQAEAYVLSLQGNEYTAWVEIENLTGEFVYNSLYFELHTPEGDIVTASSLGPDPSLGSGDIRTGDRRRGTIMFEVPQGMTPNEMVLIDTDGSTAMAVWLLDQP